MPYTKRQKRLFFAKARRGEMSMGEARRLARKPTKPEGARTHKGPKRRA